MVSHREADEQHPAGPARLGGSLLGAAVVAGWILSELTIFVRGGEPALVVRTLGPAWLLALALGALTGALLGRRPAWLVALALLLAAASYVVRSRASFHYGHPGYLMASAAGLCTALALAACAERLLSSGRLRNTARAPARIRGVATGALLGAAACVACGRLQFATPLRLPHEVLVPLGLATALELAAALGFIGGQLRALGAFGAALLCLGLLWRSVADGAELGPPGLAGPPPASTAGAPNVVLVVLDTVRADSLSCYGYERETTPGLDAFAREEATRYTNARSTAPYTLGSHASLLTGLFPSQHGASVGGPGSRSIRREVSMLGERFAAAGYRTGAIVANRAYLNRRLGFDRGFHHFDERVGTRVGEFQALGQMLAAPRLGHLYRDARRITDLALEWVDGLDGGPFFLFLNYLDAHSPLRPPHGSWEVFAEPGRTLLEHSFAERRRLLYDTEIRVLDEQLTRLRAGLRERGVYDDALLAITADHGHAFGEHGHDEHSWLLYEEQLHVPLLVKPPRSAGERGAAVDERFLTGPDVHDLLLRAAGLEVPARPPTLEGLTGEWYPWSLTPNDRLVEQRVGRDLTRHLITWVRGSRKLIVYSDGEVEAYDLERDPLELHPLELTEAELEAARAEAAAWWEAHPPYGEETGDTDTELDEELRRELSELGYG